MQSPLCQTIILKSTLTLHLHPSETFFELQIEQDSPTLKELNNIELIASKTYHASGVITIAVYYEKSIFVVVQDAGKENPLLDSRFPDVASKGRGFSLQHFGEDGSEDWPQLRKVSLWQNKAASNRNALDEMARMEADAKVSSRPTSAGEDDDSQGKAGPERTGRESDDAHMGQRDNSWRDEKEGADRGHTATSARDIIAEAKKGADNKSSDDADTKGLESPTALIRHASFESDDEIRVIARDKGDLNPVDTQHHAQHRDKVDASALVSPSSEVDRAHRNVRSEDESRTYLCTITTP